MIKHSLKKRLGLTSLVLMIIKFECVEPDYALTEWKVSSVEVHDGRFRTMDRDYRYHFTSERVIRQTISSLLFNLRRTSSQ